MAKQNKPDTPMGDVTLGPVTIPQAWLTSVPVESYARNGVILANERIKVVIPVNDVPCGYTLSLYVQRDPITEAEAAKVESTKTERDTAKNDKVKAETERLAREKRAAFELGQESTMNALKNIGQLAQAAQLLHKIGA